MRKLWQQKRERGHVTCVKRIPNRDATNAMPATDAKASSNKCLRCNKCNNKCNKCRGVQLMQLRCNKCRCNGCSNKCDNNNDENNRCSIGGCAQIVPGAQQVLTQQTISGGMKVLDGGCNLLENWTRGPEM